MQQRILAAVLVICFAGAGCSQVRVGASRNLALTASTPCDDEIKRALTIPVETKCDFIRWDLVLSQDGPKTFTLNINFGESQPNTKGFWNGGEKLSFAGSFETQKGDGVSGRQIYRLKSDRTAMQVSLVRINENLFHLLSPDSKMLLNSDGGWSYTINRRDAVPRPAKPAVLISSSASWTAAEKVRFVGRTPCHELALRLEITEPDCHKLKWDLTLFRDPATHRPTTYSLKRTGHRQSEITGKWSVSNGYGPVADALVYRLDPDKPERSIAFLSVGDDLLLFLDADGNLMTGNEDFSWTLNRLAEKR